MRVLKRCLPAGRPRFRAWVEQYEGRLDVWSLDLSHFVEYSVDEVMGRTEGDPRERKKIQSYEDWWVECEPAGDDQAEAVEREMGRGA